MGMNMELWEEEELRRKHVRSPSEIGILYVFESNCLAMLENSVESDSLDKKTVIVMVGLPVFFVTVYSLNRQQERVIFQRCYIDI